MTNQAPPAPLEGYTLPGLVTKARQREPAGLLLNSATSEIIGNMMRSARSLRDDGEAGVPGAAPCRRRGSERQALPQRVRLAVIVPAEP